MKKHLLPLLLMTVLFSCEDTIDSTPSMPVQPAVNCDTFPLPTIGQDGGACVINKFVNRRFAAFRGEFTETLDINKDGEDDVYFKFIDESYGIAGPPRGEIQVGPIKITDSISQVYVEREYCRRYFSGIDGLDTIHFYGYIDGRPCDQYTEEELMEYDTFSVEIFADFMVQDYQEGETIPSSANWTNNTILLTKNPVLPGNFDSTTPKYILFKQGSSGEVKYGWVKFIIEYGYFTGGIVISYGAMR
ncbi:hypothetical protein [Lewinella sp. LCG006]|uniref:hypothetical protein n=1 Tax=Lewinella sp. LCG006 TaxID=3231911 RepID=UPI00345FF9FE